MLLGRIRLLVLLTKRSPELLHSGKPFSRRHLLDFGNTHCPESKQFESGGKPVIFPLMPPVSGGPHPTDPRLRKKPIAWPVRSTVMLVISTKAMHPFHLEKELSGVYERTRPLPSDRSWQNPRSLRMLSILEDCLDQSVVGLYMVGC